METLLYKNRRVQRANIFLVEHRRHIPMHCIMSGKMLQPNWNKLKISHHRVSIHLISAGPDVSAWLKRDMSAKVMDEVGLWQLPPATHHGNNFSGWMTDRIGHINSSEARRLFGSNHKYEKVTLAKSRMESRTHVLWHCNWQSSYLYQGMMEGTHLSQGVMES